MVLTTVEHGRAHISVTDDGEGRAITFLHAGVADQRSWVEVMGILSKSYRTLSYDQRGYGETTYEPEPYSHTGDLLAVLDALEADSTVLIGCSRGGQIAFDAAVRHPERVEALVLIGSAPSGGPEEAPVSPAVTELFDAINQADEAGRMAELNELEARLWLDGAEAPPGRVGGAARDLFLDMNGRAMEATPPGEAAPFAGWEQLSELSLPTLLMVGTLDLPPLVARVKAMAKLIAGARLVLIDSSAHLPMLEHPALVADHVVTFLDGLG